MRARVPVLLGLTGAIGMGKTRAARAFRLAGAAVFDSDAQVHALLAPRGAAVAVVVAAFPGAKAGGGVDRRRLGDLVFGNPEALARLEAILHPRVFARQRAFVAACARRGQRLVVLDVPLLFETGMDRWVDWVVVVSAPRRVQLGRVLRRPGMTPEKLDAIEANQFSDARQRQLADFVVPTGRARGESLRRIFQIVRLLKGESGTRWAPGWGPPRPRRKPAPRG